MKRMLTIPPSPCLSLSLLQLHIASANGYVRVVEFLLEQHVNVDAMDKDLWTPVHAAACWGHVSGVLMKYGIFISTCFSLSSQLEVLEMLAQCGADLNVRNKDDETPSGKLRYLSPIIHIYILTMSNNYFRYL